MASYLKFLALLLLVLAGIWRWQSYSEKSPATARAAIDKTAGLKFVHPLYGYELSLPYYWRDKLQLREIDGATEFWQIDGSAEKKLFSIERRSKIMPLEPGWREVGSDGDFRFGLLSAKMTAPAEMAAIADSFLLEGGGRERIFRQAIAAQNASSSGRLPVIPWK
jgi:hypothetical protein